MKAPASTALRRAAVDCGQPRVLGLSLLPLALMLALALGLGGVFWGRSVGAVRGLLLRWLPHSDASEWPARLGLAGAPDVIAPLLVLAIALPLIVAATLLAVATLMTPAMLAHVAREHYPRLERKHGGSFVGGLAGGLAATLVALIALLVSMPLWLLPPLVLVIPPLVWGWLTCRVMSYDVLAEHASIEERGVLMRRHRARLFGIGVATGYLGAAPALVFATGALSIVLAPLLVPLAVWLYTLVFAFSALWYAHFALAALQALRAGSHSSKAIP
ncbi:MAG: EI24 domain-containing protein [Burkholderiaceae bacterium]